MDLEEKKSWIGFNVFTGIGPLRFKLLREFFGSAKKAYSAPEKKLLAVGLPEKLVRRFCLFRRNFEPGSYLLRLEKLRVRPLCVAEDDYPELLREIDSSPPLIYAKTKDLETLKVLKKKSVAVVGTRKSTGYGRQVTEMIVEGLVANGLAIVSGLARGIDEIAHKAAIDSGGLTIAVLGCGLDLVYPPEHSRLAEEIISTGGAVVSEFPLGMQAVPGNFPARNRIISGLSLGVVVTEAAQDSGSLITASDAAQQGREVFAVPGPITSPLSRGTGELIKKGAKLVAGVEDILEELRIIKLSNCEFKKDRTISDGLSGVELEIIKLLENENLHIDEIARKANLKSGEVGGILSLMEIKGIIRNIKEKVYGLETGVL